MKTKLLIFTALFIAVMTQAAIWRVSADATYLPHFSTIQSAVDGAQAGDTIYVYPGSYIGVPVTKSIAIIGAGYYLAENVKDSVSKFVTSASISGNITFGVGSDYSTIQGFDFVDGHIICSTTSNIVIRGCKLRYSLDLTNCQYIKIQKSIIDGYNSWYNGWGVSETRTSIGSTNCKGILVTNCILYHQVSFDGTSDGYLKNNFIGEDINLSHSTIENNILMSGNLSLTDCLTQYNVLKTGCVFNSQLSNCVFATYAEVYPSAPLVTDHYQLAVNSVAKGKGEGGIDCGPFGGNDPYQISGVSNIPSIIQFNVRSQASNDSGLKIWVKVKGNN